MPVIEENRPWIRTGDMKPWMTSKKIQSVNHSHINNVVIQGCKHICNLLMAVLVPQLFWW